MQYSKMLIPLWLGFAAAAAAGFSSAGEPIQLGSRRELLVDNFLVERMTGVHLELHEPRSEGTVFRFDRPWEGVTSGYVTVFADAGRYRMYYRGSSDAGYTIKQGVRPDEPVVPPHPHFTCYAESSDGIVWTRPSLGLIEFNGSQDNNIVWTGMGAPTFSPFKDENPAAPADQRYKAVASSNGDGEKRPPALLGFASPDGIHWRRLPGDPLLTDGKFDSLNVVFWDRERGQYTAIYRDFRYGVRTIKYASSQDFIHWTAGQWADFGDGPDEHLYTNATVPYFRAPQIYLALPRRFEPWKTYFPEMANSSPGVSDGIFMSSRDGVHWHRFEKAFVRPGLNERNWAHRANTPAHGLLATGPDEISFYLEREYTFPTNRLERMTVRTDGFVSAQAGYPGGELITKPLVFAGSRLTLNYSTAAAGAIRLEIQDEAGHPIPGFRLEESPLIFGDQIAGQVAWKHPVGRTDLEPLAQLAGKVVRLRLVMRDADLYSLQFQ